MSKKVRKIAKRSLRLSRIEPKTQVFKPFCRLVAEPYFAQVCARPQGKGPTAQANWLKIIDFSGAGSFAIASIN